MAVATAERYAEGDLDEGTLRISITHAQEVVSDIRTLATQGSPLPDRFVREAEHYAAVAASGLNWPPTSAASMAAWYVSLATKKMAKAHGWAARPMAQRKRLVHLALFRCIVGNPFRPVACDPSWRTATVRGLARSIYAERAFDRLPILADALEEAGCAHADVLAHCRGDGPHARGCWVVDLILGKA